MFVAVTPPETSSRTRPAATRHALANFVGRHVIEQDGLGACADRLFKFG